MDEVVGVSVGAGIVEVSDGGDGEDFVPSVLFPEDLEHFGLFCQWAEFVRVCRIGDAQEQSVPIGYEVKEIEL